MGIVVLGSLYQQVGRTFGTCLEPSKEIKNVVIKLLCMHQVEY